VGDTGIEPV